VIQLKIEREALKKEKDEASKDRLEKIEVELADLEKKSADLAASWDAEKSKLASAQKIKEELDNARNELVQAQRGGKLERASELAYGIIPDLEKKLAETEKNEQQQGGAMLEEAVTDQHIAQIVSRWTGIPVDK
ncbi:MAG TPA: ATP-dependent chaperone ClpB, partial [Rhodobiaceae bacterium]|nr:ATP-dependent chaperone ClpB [Rhodobiaceae bacterium]